MYFKLTNNVIIVRLRQINGFSVKEVKDKIDMYTIIMYPNLFPFGNKIKYNTEHL